MSAAPDVKPLAQAQRKKTCNRLRRDMTVRSKASRTMIKTTASKRCHGREKIVEETMADRLAVDIAGNTPRDEPQVRFFLHRSVKWPDGTPPYLKRIIQATNLDASTFLTYQFRKLMSGLRNTSPKRAAGIKNKSSKPISIQKSF